MNYIVPLRNQIDFQSPSTQSLELIRCPAAKDLRLFIKIIETSVIIQDSGVLRQLYHWLKKDTASTQTCTARPCPARYLDA